MSQPDKSSKPGNPRARPAVPIASKDAPQSYSSAAQPAESQVDDDLVFVPAPSIDMLARTRRARATPKQSFRFIRTFVPILLTMGCTFEVLGLLWYTTGPDSPFRLVGSWLPIALLISGFCFFTLGLANVLYLKRHLPNS